MRIYPAIDLMSGQCVRLYKGSYEHAKYYTDCPIRIAQLFAQQGAEFLHIIDLDAAKTGELVNLDLIIKIKKATGLPIQLGGGIRSKQQISELLNLGMSRVILGSVAVTHPTQVKQWLKEFGKECIVLALDIRINQTNGPMLALNAWQATSEKTLWELLHEYHQSSLHVLCTDISRDGTLQGPNCDLYTECNKRFPSFSLQASGGVSNLKDLSALANIPVSGVVIGKAFYENKFSLAELGKLT